MKRIFALIICIVLVCAMPLMIFAESETEETENLSVEETIPEETVPEAIEPEETEPEATDPEETEPEETVPEETAPEETEPEETEPEATDPEETEPEETEPEETVPEETEPEETVPAPTTEPTEPTDPTPTEQKKTFGDKLAAWLEKNSGVFSIVGTIIGYGVVLYKTIKKIISSMTTMNNNAVTISENSGKIASDALAQMSIASEVVGGLKNEISELLKEVKANADEKQKLEQALKDVDAHLKTAKLANKELADELAELLVLANIPNSKKEELYSRHLAAVNAIADAEKTEVNEDVEQTE